MKKLHDLGKIMISLFSIDGGWKYLFANFEQSLILS